MHIGLSDQSINRHKNGLPQPEGFALRFSKHKMYPCQRIRTSPSLNLAGMCAPQNDIPERHGTRAQSTPKANGKHLLVQDQLGALFYGPEISEGL